MTINDILASVGKYQPALTAFDSGAPTLSDAKLVSELYAALKSYFDDIQDRAGAIIRMRESIDALTANFPAEKKAAILAIIDAP